MSTPSSSWAAKMERLRSRPHPEVIQRVVADPAAAQALTEARDAVTAARRRVLEALRDAAGSVVLGSAAEATVQTDPHYLLAHAALEQAEVAADAATVYLKFRALPSDVYDALVDKHPPREKDTQRGLRVNRETFGPPLVAACHVDVDPDGEGGWTETGGSMTEAEARELLTTLTRGDADALFSAALAVNETPLIDYVSLGKGSGPTRR